MTSTTIWNEIVADAFDRATGADGGDQVAATTLIVDTVLDHRNEPWAERQLRVALRRRANEAITLHAKNQTHTFYAEDGELTTVPAYYAAKTASGRRVLQTWADMSRGELRRLVARLEHQRRTLARKVGPMHRALDLIARGHGPTAREAFADIGQPLDHAEGVALTEGSAA